MADEIDLLHSFGNEASNLAHDGIEGAAAVAPAHLGNHAKAARMIAALGDFHIGGVVWREPEAWGGEIGDVAGLRRHKVEDAGFVLFENAAEDCAGFGYLIESDEGVHFREFADEVGRESLGKAAADDDFSIGALALVALAGGFQNGIDRFLFRGIDESAGVHDEYIRFGGVGGDFESLGFCGAEHDLGVDKIFSAAEADHANPARGGFSGRFHCGRFGRGEGSNGGRVKGVGDALLVGVGVASGRTSKTSGVDEGVTDGRGLATGVARGLGVATGKAAGGVATGWTRSHFFQVFQK